MLTGNQDENWLDNDHNKLIHHLHDTRHSNHDCDHDPDDDNMDAVAWLYWLDEMFHDCPAVELMPVSAIE